MLEIMKQKTEFGDSFEIVTEDGIFDICFLGNFDLYWIYCYNGDILKMADCKSFLITKENMFLFQLFDALYQDIKNYNIYKENEFNTKEDIERLNKAFIKYDSYQHDLLFRDNKIEWHCDDCIYEKASVFVIEKLAEAYQLTFKKGINDGVLSYGVRIRNSRSRYYPFNVPFMKMYQQLCLYDPMYHQIHMEEYLYQKRLVKRKETI